MSYDVGRDSLFHQLGIEYVGPLLDGAKPADLPAKQPARFASVLNLNTAKALGLKITRELQLQATEVTE